MSYRHEVSTVNRDERYALPLLAELESGRPHSQRTLSRSLGIALGLTNLLIRRFVRKGWVRAVHVRPNRVGYLLTPSGLREKAVRSSQAFQDKVRFYTEIKTRVAASLADLAGAAGQPSRLVFVGANEVAEIAFICLQASPSTLVGVVTENGEPAVFLGRRTSRWSDLGRRTVGREAFDVLVVTVFENREGIQRHLQRAGVDASRVVWL